MFPSPLVSGAVCHNLSLPYLSRQELHLAFSPLQCNHRKWFIPLCSLQFPATWDLSTLLLLPRLLLLSLFLPNQVQPHNATLSTAEVFPCAPSRVRWAPLCWSVCSIYMLIIALVTLILYLYLHLF